MSQPLKTIQRTSTVAWCPSEAQPTLMAMGTSANSADIMGDGGAGKLEFVTFDQGRPGLDMDVQATVVAEGGRKFNSLNWSNQSNETFPIGILAAGSQDGFLTLYDPNAIMQSRGSNPGLLHSRQVHQGAVNCVEFNTLKPNVLATCGSDGQVNILDVTNPANPALFKPGESNAHQGTEVLRVAWNKKVASILCSCSNAGTTVVWDLKTKKEVVRFQDPSNRSRISAVAWHPEVPTQLIVAYDDDRNPSLQMWDLRNCQYPFKEIAGHTKGILSISWNHMDSNLFLTCSKDNRMVCWTLAGQDAGTPELFSELSSQNVNFEAKWASHKAGLISASSFGGGVSLYSMLEKQNPASRYCPKWYTKPCGVSFGFGGRVMAFGMKAQVDGAPKASWCHQLIVPNEPEVVPAADLFEHWIAEKKLREYCQDKMQRSEGGGGQALMWSVMSTQFESDGRQRVAAILGFDDKRIESEAEKYLGQKPGAMLVGPKTVEQQHQSPVVAQPEPAAFSLSAADAEDFFDTLRIDNEAKKEQEHEKERAEQENAAKAAATALAKQQTGTGDWSSGADLVIKEALLTGNLAAAVECCFKSGRLAEGLVLASGGGTELFTRARDEYIRLQNDPFLSTMLNIMTSKFEDLVQGSNLANWQETLAILATYSGHEYQALCQRLGERLEKESFDIRSAVVCYICAGEFPKTVHVWTNSVTAGSQMLALQDLVEKMAVLQEATRFNQTDALFNKKVTQYAEILANSGRTTAAMRYLCLLSADQSSAMLRHRLHNSAPQHMAMFGQAPALPFQQMDVQIRYAPPVQAAPKAQAYAQPQHAAPAYGQRPGMPQPGMPQQGMPQQGMPQPGYGAPAAQPMAPRAPMAPAGPMPNMQPPMGGMQPPMGGVQPPMGGGVQAPGGYGVSAPAPAAGGYSAQPAAAAPKAVARPNPNASLGPAPSLPSMAPQPQMGMAPAVAPSPVAAPSPYGAQPGYAAAPSPYGRPAGSTPTAAAAAPPPAPAAPPAPVAEPMNPADFGRVQQALDAMLAHSAQDGNVRKRDDNAKRLQELYNKLQQGHMKPEAMQKVLQMVSFLEAQDCPSAAKVVKELSTMDWNLNKNWIMGVQRIIPQR